MAEPFPTHIRDAAIADYHNSGDTLAVVAERHGVSKSRLGAWIKPGHGRRKRNDAWTEADIALADGRWVRDGLTWRWQSDIAA